MEICLVFLNLQYELSYFNLQNIEQRANAKAKLHLKTFTFFIPQL